MPFIHWIISGITDRNFLATLASNFVVAAIAAIAIPWYLDWRKLKNSEIYLCDPITRRHEFALQATEGGDYKANLRLAIKNDSPFSLRDVYINFFMLLAIVPTITKDDGVEAVSEREIGNRGHRILYKMSGPVYPGRYHNFSFELSISVKKEEFSALEDPVIYYYISTEYGMFPKSAGFVNDENARLTTENFQKHSAKLKLVVAKKEHGV